MIHQTRPSTNRKGATVNDYTLVVTDITVGWTTTIKSTSENAANTSAKAIAEHPGDRLHLPTSARSRGPMSRPTASPSATRRTCRRPNSSTV